MANAALSCIALLTLVLLPVALYLAKWLRHRVGIAETHLSLCAAALPPALVACYVLGRPPLIRPWLSLVLLALVQSGGVSLAVVVLHRLCLRRVPLLVAPAVPELPTAEELAKTHRRSAFAGCAARALLPEVPALPGDVDPPSQRLQPHAERLRRHQAPLGVAALLTLLLFACAGPVPVKRTLLVRSQGEFALTLVFPGLQAHAAAPLLQADGAATCERLPEPAPTRPAPAPPPAEPDPTLAPMPPSRPAATAAPAIAPTPAAPLPQQAPIPEPARTQDASPQKLRRSAS